MTLNLKWDPFDKTSALAESTWEFAVFVLTQAYSHDAYIMCTLYSMHSHRLYGWVSLGEALSTAVTGPWHLPIVRHGGTIVSWFEHNPKVPVTQPLSWRFVNSQCTKHGVLFVTNWVCFSLAICKTWSVWW